jgi:hypothetical protein
LAVSVSAAGLMMKLSPVELMAELPPAESVPRPMA